MQIKIRLNLVFLGVDLDDDDVFDALSCIDNINWRGQGNLAYATAVVDAPNVCEAVKLIQSDVAAAVPSAELLRLDEDLVAIPDVASRVGVTREAVRNWAAGRRLGGFPGPRGIVGDGIKVWAWRDVNAWLRSNLRLGDEENLPTALEIAQVNEWLHANKTGGLAVTGPRWTRARLNPERQISSGRPVARGIDGGYRIASSGPGLALIRGGSDASAA